MNLLTLESLSLAGQIAAISGAVAAVGILVIMYFLKLKRMRREVSSTFLWRKSVQDLMANSPFQKLRRNLLLFLQLAALVAALLALGRPALISGAREGVTYVVLVDNSASMAATDVAPNRMAAAMSRAQKIVDDMGSQDAMMIMTFGSHPEVVATLTDDKSALSASIRGIRAADTSTNIKEPLELADSLAKGFPSPRIVVISDGAFPQGASIEQLNAPLEFVCVGKSGNNAGMTSMDVRGSLGDPAAGEVFARASNFGAMPVKTTISLTIDGQLTDAAELTLEPGASQAHVFKVRLDAEKVACISLDASDDLAADNAAWAILVPAADTKVVLVGGSNPFLRRALASSGRFKVSETATAPESPAVEEEVPVYVFDGVAPKALARAGYLVFNAVPPGGSFKETGEMENPVVIDVDITNPVTAFLELGDIYIDKAKRMTFPPETKVLVNSDEAPLVALSYVGGARVVTVAFDPMESRWPLRISYPMFVTNAIDFLSASYQASTARQFSAGDVLVISGEPAGEMVTVKDPGGDKSTLACGEDGTVAFGRTGTAGVYAVETASRTVLYAANLTNSRESDIAPVRQLDAGSRKVAATVAAAPKNREIWRELVLLAFVVLMIEWYIYNRRVYI